MAITADYNWRERAECAKTDLNLPFGDTRDEDEPYNDGDARRFAVEVCGKCPVIFECLMYAKENHIPYGVFGGKTPAQRGWRSGTN